jgi:beta-galactosidase
MGQCTGSDLYYCRGNGQRWGYQPNAANPLHFTIEGPGVMAGVDNADMKDYDLYVSNTRKAWHGRALVVIKSTRNIGDIKLTVTSPGLSDATIGIKTISTTK